MSVSMSLGGRPPAHHTARQCAIAALEAGNLNGQTDGPRSGTAFVPATSWRERLTNSGWACAKVAVPLGFAACTGLMLLSSQVPLAETMVLSAMTGVLAGSLHASRFTRENAKEFIRIGFTQLSSQMVSAMTLKFGFEQLAIHVDPSLSATGFHNGSHWASLQADLPGNSTEVHALDHERLWPGGAAWWSLLVVGLPVVIQFTGFLMPVRGGTTSVDALLDRLRLDASHGPARIEERWSDSTDRLVRTATKVGIGATGLAIVGGLLATGQRKLAMRILSNANQVQLAARMRDFMNMLMRGAGSGSPESERWADSGWHRQQQVKIPDAVLVALTDACTDPATGQLDATRHREGMRLLRTWYRNLFIGARVCSLPVYAGASAFGLYIMRDFFAPKLGGVYADGFSQALAVAVPVSLGTAFTEGIEEPGWATMVSLWADMHGMPIEIARAPSDPTDQVRANFRQLGMSALVPGHPLIRSAFPSCYARSTVTDTPGSAPGAQLSLSDRLELNSGIRAGQNLVTMVLLTSAGTADDPQTRAAFYSMGVLLNAATHFRGNVVAQLLDSGREARLLHDWQQGAAGDEDDSSSVISSVDMV